MRKSKKHISVNLGVLTHAHGPVSFKMTNDYLFRAVFQKNNLALRGLIADHLHLKEKDILSVVITNPIELGEDLESKEFRLDLHVILNDNTYINLEMQVTNEYNWPNRSLSYICRSYDQLARGEDYNKVRPVIHISFLDFTLFPDHPEFYATYKILNSKKYHIYNDNFILNVIDLTKINLATEEDRLFSIDDWARFFKATTWEEIKMLATKNPYILEAANTMFKLCADSKIRKICQDREDYQFDIRSYQRGIEERDATISEMGNSLSEKDAVISEKDATISEMGFIISEKDATISEISTELAQLKDLLATFQKQNTGENPNVNLQ